MHDEVMARRRAAAQAGFLNDPGAALAALDDADASVRIAGLRSADRLDALDPDRLVTLLADPEPAVRIAALDVAAHRHDPDIVGLLDDPVPAVVEMAAWACGERDSDPRPSTSRLAQLATGHDDPLVREAAVAAIGAIGDELGLPAVLKATTDKPAVRRRAVLALAAFDGPEVDAAWERARSDRDRQVRDAVDELLGPSEGA